MRDRFVFVCVCVRLSVVGVGVWGTFGEAEYGIALSLLFACCLVLTTCHLLLMMYAGYLLLIRTT